MNAKILFQCLVTALVLAFATTASAQTIPETSTQLPPKMAACLRACMGGQPAVPATPSCNGLSDVERAKITKMAADIAVLQGQVNALQKKYGELKARLDKIDEKDADRDAKIEQLRSDINALREDLDKKYKLLIKDYVDLDVRLGAKILKLQQDVTALDTRVSDLEASRPRIGPRVGLIVLPALDGSMYTGMPVTARLQIFFNRKTWLALDGGATFSFASSPVGAYGRAGVGYDFHPNWYVTGGVSTLWAGYDDKLKAKAAYIPFDGGVGFRYGVFDASVNVLAGPKFGHGGTSFALGGAGSLGLTF